ncbi:hypothetical protein LCGC14_3037880 [marine sediment metagenome]|uniref:Bacteriophage Mu Gp45 N-terminal domain-containing protein n=1 Tax=marine sediment metagenome TaxID=412755 RepID=A0A0F8YYG0_9ZZZZ
MTEEELDDLEILLRPIVNQIANVVARAVIKRTDDSAALQKLQISVLESEPIDDAEHFQQYGFSSVPLTGAEAVVVFPGGDHAHPLVVAIDDRRHRPTGLKGGEVTVYHQSGSFILLRDDGSIGLRPKAGKTIDILEVGAGSLGATDEVVHGTGIDPFTGATYKALGSTSGKLRAEK